ncbi:GNAT family N-acetyltransferase [Arthrobacter sp. MDT3-44]
MTELLHPDPTEPSTALALDESDIITSPTTSPSDSQTSRVRAARHAPDGAALEGTLTPEGLAALPTRHLRILVNQAYQVMDTDYPPTGAIDRYEMIVDELQHRAQQATKRSIGSSTVHKVKETFRDNPLYCRFELFIDGDLAACMKYTMNGGHVILIAGIEHPEFRDQGIDATLMHHIVLNTHKRRLSLIPQCPMAHTFLADNPQYQTLTGRPRP